MRSSCSGHHAARTEPLICPTTRPSTPQSRQPWLHQHKATKAWPQNFATFRLHACFHKFRIRQTQLHANSTKPSEAAIAETAAPHSETARPPLGYPCARHAATDTRRGSRVEAALRHHRFTAGHPGPEPHHVSRPWRPAVGLWPRLIPSVASVTRDPFAGYVTSIIKPPGQPPMNPRGGAIRGSHSVG